MNYYGRYYRSLLRGREEVARGHKVYCKRNVEFAVPIGTTYRREGDNPAIGIVEGLQFIAGMFDKSHIEKVAPRAQLNLFTGQSSYGPRVVSQWHAIINELRHDANSRRAVLILPDAHEDLADRPCTTSMQFSIVNGELNTLVNMRSSDAVWGLPYDLIQFSMVTMMLAHCLDRPYRELRVFIGNAHIYDATHKEKRTWKKAKFDLMNLMPLVPTPNSWKDKVREIFDDPDFSAPFLRNLVNLRYEE